MSSRQPRQQAPVLLLEDSIPRSLLYIHHIRQAGIPVIHAAWTDSIGHVGQYRALVLSLLETHVMTAIQLLERTSPEVPVFLLGDGPLSPALLHASNVVAYIDRSTTLPKTPIEHLLQFHIIHINP